MRLEELDHLPIVKGDIKGMSDPDMLSRNPAELAEVEFEESGQFRPIYIRGIIVSGQEEVPWLVWGKSLETTTGYVTQHFATELDKITNYRTQVSVNPFQPIRSEEYATT